MKYNKIALIGMMGCGKTTIAKKLSYDLKLTLFEADKIFEQKENISIKDFFDKYGEEIFRIKETEILKEIAQKNNFILSCGGGIILKEENRKLLFETDITTIYLQATSDSIYKRIKHQTQRPLLLVENPQEKIQELLTQREEYYNLAKFKITTDNKTVDEIKKEIKEIIWKE